MPWPDKLLKIANSWGKRGKYAIQRGHLKFLDQNGETFDWKNDNLANLEMDWTENKLIHPDFIAELPGIETETNCEGIMCPHSSIQDYTLTADQ